VTIYNEVVETGGWLLVVEIVAVIAVTLGCIQLSRSLSMVHGPQPAAPPAPEPVSKPG
jgi:hypothetical protein